MVFFIMCISHKVGLLNNGNRVNPNYPEDYSRIFLKETGDGRPMTDLRYILNEVYPQQSEGFGLLRIGDGKSTGLTIE
jgi:hypothetical protein